MTDIGYTLSTEEFGPNELVSQAKGAEDAGFDFLSSSDHYHPWVSAQGEAPFVWSVLGGVAEATDEIDVGIGVNCPIMRIHPAVVAHAAATAGAMLDGRFFVPV
jgi:coenzyme F420-dependent glucose-6-phosphate dehydrogenase